MSPHLVFCILALVLVVTGRAEPPQAANRAVDDAANQSTMRTPKPSEGSIDSGGKFRAHQSPPRTNSVLTRPAAEEALAKALDVRTIDETTLAVGPVVVDRKARTITIPARVNLLRGPLEYALVAESGKVHESLFATAATPEQVHVAALLLGMKANRGEALPDGGLRIPAAGAVTVEVTWKKHGPDARHALEALVVEAAPPGTDGEEPQQVPLAAGAWHYNGSRFHSGRFMASQEGSFIALISDQAALVNNPRPGRMRDDRHFAHTKLLPPVRTPVHLVLTLPDKKTTSE